MNRTLPRRLDVRTIAGATLAALAPGLALAGPHGESVVAGLATVGRPDLLTTVVNQTSAAAVINWQQFNVGADEFVVFQQPSSSSVVLNRIVGNDASQIFGSISANGRVFLANPNGVLFAPGARLDVGGLVATTFGISDDDFMAGRYAFARAAGAPDAGVVNQGAVQTAAGGFVVLAGDFVRNEGVIAAPAGSVVLASGARTTLNLDGMGLVDFAVDEPTLSAAAGVTNAGQILAEGGMVVMTARVANQLVATVVNNSGLVRASRIGDRGGELWLLGEGGDVADSGVLDASGVDGDGGRAVVWGDRDVTITGAIVADGAGAGAGGEVRAIAEGRLELAAGSAISARGGPDPDSRGGIVEVSGHGVLSMRGAIDLGAGGELLIDPSSVTLLNGASSIAGGSVGSIHVQFIQAQLNAGVDVKVLASNTIGASSSVAPIVSTNPSGDLFLEIGTSAPLCQSGIAAGICTNPPAFGSFTAVQGGAINLADLDIDIAGALHLEAWGSGSAGGTIDLGIVSAGSITANNAGNRFNQLDAVSLTATAGDISLYGRNFISIGGDLIASGGSVLAELTGGTSGATISVSGAVSATGNVQVEALGQYSTYVSIDSVLAGGTINLTAGAYFGAGNITVTGDVIGGGAVQIQANDFVTGSNYTRIDVSGSVQGAGIDIDAHSVAYGGHVSILGDLTATAGPIQVDATGYGSSSGFSGGTITVDGAVAAAGASGDVTLFTQDLNGGGGGKIAIGSVSGHDLYLTASGGGGSEFGGGTILIGAGAGSSGSLAGGTLTATGDAFLSADGINVQSGLILVGDATVGGRFDLSVGGGPNGGRIVFADLLDSTGTVISAATIDVGDAFSAILNGDVGDLVAGDITATSIEIDVTRNAASFRDASVTTGVLTADGTGPSDGVKIAVHNDAAFGVGTATVTVGDVHAAGLQVALDTRVYTSSGSSANIFAGDITGGFVSVDNDRFNDHSGSIFLGAINADFVVLASRNHISAGNLTATRLIDAEATLGDISLGDLVASDPLNPVVIDVLGSGIGNLISVGSITASGRRSASGPNGYGARVTIDAGSSGGGVIVGGPIAVTGIGRAYLEVTIDAGPSDPAHTTNGFGGFGVVTLRTGSTGTITAADPAGITITGVGGAMLQAQGGAVTITGPISVNATPATLTTTGRLGVNGCVPSCDVSFSEVHTNGGDAMVSIGSSSYQTALIDVGAITVNGPQATIELSGQDIQTGALAATGGNSHYHRTSSGTVGGLAQSFSDDLLGGGADIELTTGTGTTSIVVSGPISAAAPGFGGVLLVADNITVGDVSVSATGGLFTRSGAPANSYVLHDGPFGQDFGDGLPGIATGTFTGGFAQIRIGDDGGCAGCDLAPATSVSVLGDLSANAPGSAAIELVAFSANVTGAMSAIATLGSRVGVDHSTFLSSSSVSYSATETIDFVGGAARISVDGGGTLGVGGTLTADGAFATIELGISAGSLGAVVVNIGGGDGDFTGVYDAAGTVDDYTTSFHGPGGLQGFVAGVDGGGSGSIVVGPIAVHSVGFGAVIIRAGTVATFDIDLDATNATYQFYDSRIDAAPQTITIGDALLAVAQQDSAGSYSRATVNGPITVDATGAIFLRSQFDVPADATKLQANGYISQSLAPYLDRINDMTCTGSSCSLGSFAANDLSLYTGALIANTAIDLPTSSITFGSGDVGAFGDPAVVAAFGLGHANPNGLLRTNGSLDLGHVGLTGDYLLIEGGISNAVPTGSASVNGGAVVQFARPGGTALALQQSAGGAGVVAVTNDVAAFMGQSAELVFGRSAPGNTLTVGTAGAVNLGGESVTLLGAGGISGTNPLVAGSITVAAGAGAVTLVAQTATFDVKSASSVVLDDLANLGATTVTLGAGLGAADLRAGGALTVIGPFSGSAFSADAAGNLTLGGAFAASGVLDLATGGLFAASAPLAAGTLVLDGVAGLTDFNAITNAATIVIDGADAVALNNSARTGGTQLSIVGASPNALDVLAGGGLAVSGGFSGTTLTLAGSALDLGAAAHSASGAISLTTAGALNAPALLTAGSITIDAVAASALALTTNTGSLAIDAASALNLNNTAQTGAVTLALPAGLANATLAFGGSATLTGSFNGGSFDVSAPGGLDLGSGAFTSTSALGLHTDGAFSASGLLSAADLTLDGASGITDFLVTANSGAITVIGAGTATIDDSAHTGATLLTLVGTSPTALDLIAGGDITLNGAFSGTTLALTGANLALGPTAHTATASLALSATGNIVATGLLTTAAFSATTTAAVPLAFTTDAASIGIGGGSTLSINNNAHAGAVSFALPGGLTVANLAFGGDVVIGGAFNGTSLNFAAAGALDLTGAGYTTSGTMFLSAGTSFSASSLLAAGTLSLNNAARTADFVVTTNAGSVQVNGGNSVVLDNTARTAATTVAIGASSPLVLDVASGGALTVTGTFSGTGLTLDATSLDLGAANHSASGGMSLTSAGTFNATGTLAAASLSIDLGPTADLALTTTTPQLLVVEARNVTVDATPVGGTLALGFGAGPFGAVNITVHSDLVLTTDLTATLLAVDASTGISGSGITIVADTVFLQTPGDIALAGTAIGIGLGDGTTGVTDGLLLQALASATIGPATQTVSNGTFLAGGALSLGTVTSQGSYLVLQGDLLALTGPISGATDLLVQIAPATSSNTFSIEDSLAGTAATNYTFSSQLGQVTALTLVIGASTASGDATVGANGAFDVTPLNLIVATGGTVTSIGNVTSTGIVDTLVGLINGGAPPPPPPILVEIDPYVADPLPPVDTSAGVGSSDGSDDEDDEGEDTSDSGTEQGGQDDGLVSQQNPAPIGVCGK